MVKKFSILICFMFVLAFGSVVSADEVQSKDADSSVVISEDEYNDLLNRITELENLKSDEINNNLLEFYEKSQADQESNLASIFDGLTNAITVLAIFVAILGFVNFNSVNNAIDKSEKAVDDIENKAKTSIEKAEKLLEKVEVKIEKSEEKNSFTLKEVKESSEKAINKNTEKVNETIEKANKSIAEVNENLEKYKKIIRMQEIYKNKIILDAHNDPDFKIKIYSKIIEELEKENIKDEFIYLERANVYISTIINFVINQFQNEVGDHKRKIYIDVEDNIELKNKILFVAEAKNNNLFWGFIDNAISDLKIFIENNNFTDTDDSVIFAKMKLVECYLYKFDYDKAFDILKYVNKYGIYNKEMSELLVSIVIVDIENYEKLLKEDILGEKIYDKTLCLLRDNIEKIINNSVLAILANIEYNNHFNNGEIGLAYNLKNIDSLIKLTIGKSGNSSFAFNPTKIKNAIDELSNEVIFKESLNKEFKEIDDYLRVNGNNYYKPKVRYEIYAIAEDSTLNK